MLLLFGSVRWRQIAARQARIIDNALNDEAMPNQEDDEGAQGGADEARALVWSIPTYALADPGGTERAGDTEYGREDKSLWVVGAW